MKKVSIIGHFGGSNEKCDGQTVKTTIVTEELERVLGPERIDRINTHRWKKNPFRLLVNCIKSVFFSENVIFLTDEGGIKVFPKLLNIVNFSGKCKIHYYVVGGWLNSYLTRFPKATSDLKKLDVIYVEIPTMLRELNNRGLDNVVLVNKFRRMIPVDREELVLEPDMPYKLCYFSRVMKEKGVEECISVVNLLNEREGFTKYTLDIFGAINEPYKHCFGNLEKEFPDYIRYCGIIDFQKSGNILKDYFAMLFPTCYASEGYPNVVVDAFSAGLPVIATRWNYNTDIIRDHEDGFLIDVGSIEQLANSIEELVADVNFYSAMRLNCLSRCSEYLPENAISKVLAQLK